MLYNSHCIFPFFNFFSRYGMEMAFRNVLMTYILFLSNSFILKLHFNTKALIVSMNLAFLIHDYGLRFWCKCSNYCHDLHSWNYEKRCQNKLEGKFFFIYGYGLFNFHLFMPLVWKYTYFFCFFFEKRNTLYSHKISHLYLFCNGIRK